MKPSSNTPSEAEAMSLDDPNPFGDEGTIELTEVVDEPEDVMDFNITVDSPQGSPEELHRKLKEELLHIGGKIQEWRMVENHILAKVEISNELYVATCALEGIEIRESIATIREGVHLVLKGQEAGFHVLGGDWMNYVEPFVVDMGYSSIEKTDQFSGLSANLERCASRRVDEAKREQKKGGLGTMAS